MKKLFTIFFVFILGLTVVSCGDKEQEPVDITLWNYYTGAQLNAFNALVDEFNQTKGKELKITVHSSSEGNVGNLETNVLAAAKKEPNAKEMPNIFAAYSDTAYTINSMDRVADLNKYLTEAEKNEYVTNYIEEGDLNGNGSFKIFPIAKSTEIMLINKTDWNKFAGSNNVSYSDLETFEGVARVSKMYYEWTDSLTSEPNDGKALFGRDAMANYMLIGAMQLGTEIISVENGNSIIDFNQTTIKALWDNFYTPYISGYYAANGKFRSDDVMTGDILAFVGSSTSASWFPKEVKYGDGEEDKYAIECEILKAPQFASALANNQGYAVQQGAGMVVTKPAGEVTEEAETEIKASVEFLKWFTAKEQNINFAVDSGYMPVKKEANMLETITNFVGVEGLTKSLTISLETVNNNSMYTPVATENGKTVRQILDTCLIDKAKEDRIKVEEALQNGLSHTEAVASVNTLENFETWYTNIKNQIEDLA